MIHEPFAAGDSILHRLDPRLKIVYATFFSVVVALSSSFHTLICALLLSLCLTATGRLRFYDVVKRISVVNGLILFLWLALPLTYQGESLFNIGPLAVTRPGVILAGRITFKSNAIVLALIALIATSPVATLGYALHRMHMPSKIVHLLLLTYRYIFVIEQEFQRLTRAAKIRGFRPGTNMHTYKTYAYFIGMLFVRASARAERVYQAMLCRGFEGRFYCLCDFSLNRLDWVSATFLTVAILGLMALEWTAII